MFKKMINYFYNHFYLVKCFLRKCSFINITSFAYFDDAPIKHRLSKIKMVYTGYYFENFPIFL